MHPAFSVIFLTTLIGVGQGMFLAMFTGQSYAAVQLLSLPNTTGFYAIGSMLAFLFLVAGLVASFFHLGRPERAWRSAAQWRTSWLSREVIALPIVMGLVFIYAVMHFFNWDFVVFTGESGARANLTLMVGGVGVLFTFILFICTGMIYACIKFLQEWASPLTVVNYTLLGTASGFTLATAYAQFSAPELANFYGIWAIIITVAALVTRAASLVRNFRLKPKSTLQTAIGVRHTKITQKSMGFMSGSMNTRDFFHHQTQRLIRNMKWVFIFLTFIAPITMLAIGVFRPDFWLFLAAFVVQYIGLVAERWYFFAQANHPQNLYYQTV